MDRPEPVGTAWRIAMEKLGPVVVGALIGAAATMLVQSDLNRDQLRMEHASQAYVKYIAAALSGALQHEGDWEPRMAEAVAMIVVYGKPEVLQAVLAAADPNRPRHFVGDDFLSVLLAMARGVGKGDITEKEWRRLLEWWLDPIEGQSPRPSSEVLYPGAPFEEARAR